jgi:peptide/nickel transport system substrate-binding protein
MVAGAVASLLLAAVPVSAQVLKIGLSAEPTSIDPHYHALSPNIALGRHIFEHLVEMDATQRLTPGLAESWKVLEDGVTWEIRLRKGVVWHDGSPFTADDVLFSFERAPNVANSPGSFAYAIKGKTLKKFDDHTIHLSTGAPSPLTPNDLAAIYIVSRKHGTGATTPDYNSGKAAIGTGPYKFKEYVPGDRIVLERNDAYWGP